MEHFLPTYEEVRVWKNKQRVKLVLPLFPTYVFARISGSEHTKVLGSPGVLRIVGTSREPIPFLMTRSSFFVRICVVLDRNRTVT